jgi:hypothetical protein
MEEIQSNIPEQVSKEQLMKDAGRLLALKKEVDRLQQESIRKVSDNPLIEKSEVDKLNAVIDEKNREIILILSKYGCSSYEEFLSKGILMLDPGESKIRKAN